MRGPIAILLVALLAGCALPGDPGAPSYYFEDVLAAAPFTDLVVEIDHAPGRAPSRLAQDHLLAQLRAVTSKPADRISIVLEESLPDEARTWTADDLVALERQTRSTQHVAPVAVLHVLYPAGVFTAEDAVGVTISGPVIGPVVVFLDKMDEFRAPIPGVPALPVAYPADARDQMERVTLLHEAGHAMGLVDNGLPMVRPHEDAQSEGHSDNPRSVMTAAVDQLSALQDAFLQRRELPLYFDENDRADMRAAGGR